MLDHIGILVNDYEKSKEFYTTALAPLGYSALRAFSAEETGSVGVAGFGIAPKPDFWITEGQTTAMKQHIAFAARDRASVDAFHAAALLAGGTDNGAPGLRSHYHPNYYAAFVFDPDGYNIEAVCHAPE